MKAKPGLIPAVLLCVLCALTTGCESARKADRTARDTEVDEIFTEWDRPDSPGCALAVIDDGKIVYSRGYGMADLEHDVPITPETVFYIGSESKQFVAMSILLLEEEGKLSVDDDIRKYVPEIPDYEHPITIRHLIHHTSGLRDYFTLWSLAGIDYANYIPEGEVIELLSRQKELNFAPGEERLYSNSGYLLLAVIIERVSGKSLREFTEERIFRPLGMHNSHFHDDNAMLIKNRALGHFTRQDESWGLLTMRFSLVGSGGLYTTVNDLYLWDQNFYRNRLGSGDQGLIERMYTPGKLNSGEELNYAFALTLGEYRGLKTVRHGGALGGYRSHVLRFPDERFTVILLFNLSDVNPGTVAEKVADLYLADKLTPRQPEPEPSAETAVTEAGEKPEPVTLSAAELAEYAGEYKSDELQATYRLIVRDGALMSRVRHNPWIELPVLEKDAFGAQDMRFTFERDNRGKITGFNIAAGRVKNIRFVRL